MITLGAIAALQAHQNALFRDACKIGKATLTDAHDPTAMTWVYGEEIACGFKASPPKETQDGAEVTITDAVIRVPIGTEVSAQDRIKITTRNLSALATEEVYAVVGEPVTGMVALICQAKRLTGESVL